MPNKIDRRRLSVRKQVSALLAMQDVSRAIAARSKYIEAPVLLSGGDGIHCTIHGSMLWGEYEIGRVTKDAELFVEWIGEDDKVHLISDRGFEVCAVSLKRIRRKGGKLCLDGVQEISSKAIEAVCPEEAYTIWNDWFEHLKQLDSMTV